MPKIPKTRSRSEVDFGSLVGPKAMGGINAGKGFDFQARFAACHVPTWLADSGFHQLFYEGTGDIDVRYQEAGTAKRAHIQVKDHEVAPAEFKESLTYFRALNSSLPGAYERFTLVCPAFSAKMRPVEAALARYRNAKPFYDDDEAVLRPTKDEVDSRLRKLGLDESEVAFVHSFVNFEIGHADLQQDKRAHETFMVRLLQNPDYAHRLLADVEPAFAQLLHALQGKRGQVLERAEVAQILRGAVAAAEPAEKSAILWMQNWTTETFDVPADYIIDWSSHFDRATRRVPEAETWNCQLLPELKALREKIQRERAERFIRFRGKCSLSSGIALGATFPVVGGWVFEISQPPLKEAWRSDANPTTPCNLRVELIDAEGTDLVLGVNVRGDCSEEIRGYLNGSGEPPKLFAFVAPYSVGSRSITSAEDAVAFASAVREQLGQLIQTHGIRRTRLFFYGPLALAVFLGQQLTSVGEVLLFEYQTNGYVPSCTLQT